MSLDVGHVRWGGKADMGKEGGARLGLVVPWPLGLVAVVFRHVHVRRGDGNLGF